MTPRRLAVGMAALAALIQLGLTRSWQNEAAAVTAEHARLANDERALRRRLADLEARAVRHAEAVARVGRSAASVPTNEALHEVRRRVVTALEDSSARLEVRPGPSPAVASVVLQTDGRFTELIDLTSALGPSGAGLVFGRLSFTRGTAGSSLHVEAGALGGTP